MLAYQSFLKDNDVIGISIKSTEVSTCQFMFNEYLKIPECRLSFREASLYDLTFDLESFDEIICSEVLEHLRRDGDVCRTFWRILKPNGLLHVCAPNAVHPYNASFPLDSTESGGHVRPGYTVESYRSLLEPIGFKIIESKGLGGPVRQLFNRWIKASQLRFGPAFGIPLFLVASLALPFESRRREKEVPFSIYIKAVKSMVET